MSSDLQRDLIAYRLEQARKVLEEAVVLQKGGHLLGTVNRAYYAMFYSIQALLERVLIVLLWCVPAGLAPVER